MARTSSHRSRSGPTELAMLFGIVMLLVAIVLMSARGAAHLANGTACAADRSNLEEAEEQYLALHGHYAGMDALLHSGLVGAPSTLHTVELTGSSTQTIGYSVMLASPQCSQ